MAGNKIDEAIAGFLKKQHAILVTDRVAEQIKFDLADVRSEKKMEHIAVVRGRDIATGMPLTVDVNMANVSEAIREPLQEILGAIKWVLGRVPPELCCGYPAKWYLSDGRFGGAAEFGYHDRDGIWRTGICRQRRGRMHDARRRLYGGSL